MKKKDLKEGVIYRCKLSNVKVLTVLMPEQLTKDQKGDDITMPETMVGRIVVCMDTGDFKYVMIEINDGQLEEVTNN